MSQAQFDALIDADERIEPDDWMPDEVRPASRDVLTKLQAQAPVVPLADMLNVFIDEVGEPPDEVFAEFHDEPIAAASIGQVYRAVLKSGEQVAVKLIDKAACAPAQLAAIRDELAILAALPAHPRVVPLTDIVDGPAAFALVMPCVRGGELFERVVARERYAESDARRCVRNILGTIAFLHAHGVAHRDLKPENILLRGSDDDTDLVLVDFGIAKSFVSDYAMRTPCGSVHYTAPEVMRAVPYGPKADVWSIGVISCSSSAATWLASSRRASTAPWTLG